MLFLSAAIAHIKKVSPSPYPLDGLVDRLEGLEPLRHEQVGELFVDGLHPLGHLQDPLLVRVGSIVVRRSAEWEREREGNI